VSGLALSLAKSERNSTWWPKACSQLVQGGDRGKRDERADVHFFMIDTMQSIFINSFQIAWDYLEATGERGNPDRAAQHLLDTIEAMILHDERRQLLLANNAIASYQSLRAERGLSIAS
jgi:hypothetical protein